MHREVQVELAKRLCALIDKGSTELAERVYHLPVSKFIDLDYHQAELEGLFYEMPQPVGFSAELNLPDRFITRTLVDGSSLIVTRDRNHQLHALLNVCRHRGARVVESASGKASRLICPFHAWCYSLDGNLVAIPGNEGFPGLSKADYSLVKLSVEERHGLIWLHPRRDKSTLLSAWLGTALDEELSSFDLAQYTLFRQQTFPVRANWKLTMDGFLESYHVGALHRNSIGAYFYSNLNCVDVLGRHLRLVLPRRRIDRMFELTEDHWSLLDNTVVVYVVIPGLVIAWQSGHFDVFRMCPDRDNPAKTQVTLSMLIPYARCDETDLWERNWERTTTTIGMEDFAQAAKIQSGFAAKAQRHLTVGRNEMGMQSFYRSIEHLVGV